MRHLLLSITQDELATFRSIKAYKERGWSDGEIAAQLGLTYQRVAFVWRKGRTSKLQLKERRKQYICDRHEDRRVAHRHTPHVISRYFKVEESYVSELIKELRNEGRLPPVEEGDKEWQDALLNILRREYPNVYRAATVGLDKKIGDKVQVAGKGWLTWAEVKTIAEWITAGKIGRPLTSKASQLT